MPLAGEFVLCAQKSLQAALEQLVYAMDVWATVGQLAPKGAYEISFEWDDSIVVDTAAEQNIRLQEVAAGILNPIEYVKWRYGINDDAEARKMMPGMEGLMNDAPAAADGAVREAEDAAGHALNGAQTQSLIAVISQYQVGALSIGQAINVISVAIGVTKEDAKKILEGIE